MKRVPLLWTNEKYHNTLAFSFKRKTMYWVQYIHTLMQNVSNTPKGPTDQVSSDMKLFYFHNSYWSFVLHHAFTLCILIYFSSHQLRPNWCHHNKMPAKISAWCSLSLSFWMLTTQSNSIMIIWFVTYVFFYNFNQDSACGIHDQTGTCWENMISTCCFWCCSDLENPSRPLKLI